MGTFAFVSFFSRFVSVLGIMPLLLFLWFPTYSYADSGDHERALQAMEAGEIKPLVQILELLKEKEPGRILAVELEQKSDRWIYEIKMIQSQGRVRKFKVDAKTGSIIKIKND